MSDFLLKTFALVALTAVSAQADYAWIPNERNLFVRLGGDWSRSSENFVRDGERSDLVFQNRLVRFNEFRLWVDPEYGFARDWAVALKLNYINNSTDEASGNSLLTGNGLGDIGTSLKWRVKGRLPTLTLETKLQIPTYSNLIADSNYLVLGDGNVDLGLILHSGFVISKFFFAVSPGLLFRFGGYSSAFTLDGGAGLRFHPLHVFLFSNLLFSFTENLLFDGGLDAHNALGTGSSYARLSGSPKGFSAGLRIGVRIGRQYFLEASGTQSLWGRRYPNFFRVGINLFAMFDFSTPDTRIRIKEVPFEDP